MRIIKVPDGERFLFVARRENRSGFGGVGVAVTKVNLDVRSSFEGFSVAEEERLEDCGGYFGWVVSEHRQEGDGDSVDSDPELKDREDHNGEIFRIRGVFISRGRNVGHHARRKELESGKKVETTRSPLFELIRD